MSAAAHKMNSAEQESELLQEALRRAERAERELAELKEAAGSDRHAERPVPDNTRHMVPVDAEGVEVSSRSDLPVPANESADSDGLNELRKDGMMAHLLDSLDAGEDIGHYGRLVFAMIARHFLSEADVIGWLTKDVDFSQEAATLMMKQVAERNYNPPRKERILEWQREQEFVILPNAEDPETGNVYRTLKFPDGVYEHIQNYQVEKMEASA